MDHEQTVDALLLKNELLVQENDQLKSMLSIVKENIDLRAKVQRLNNNTHADLTASEILKQEKMAKRRTILRRPYALCSISGRKPSIVLQNSVDEREFRKGLQRSKSNHERRVSSPVDFKSFIQSSMHTDASEKAECSYQAEVSLEMMKEPERILGEIAHQLDKRMLMYVFQGRRRLYGFTLLNIQAKIIEVSTHPLTGMVDEGYRLHLTQRYADLMEWLSKLGYKAAIHPTFTEFVVNIYGILKERPGEHSTQGIDYNNPDHLRNVIMKTTPTKLQKDLLLVLLCLCNMAEKDGKPLMLWK